MTHVMRWLSFERDGTHEKLKSMFMLPIFFPHATIRTLCHFTAGLRIMLLPRIRGGVSITSISPSSAAAQQLDGTPPHLPPRSSPLTRARSGCISGASFRACM